MGIQELTEAARQLHPTVRVAEYLKRTFALAAVGARLRAGRGYERDNWTAEEEAQWDAACDEIEPYFYALTDYEKQWLRKNYIDSVSGLLSRGEEIDFSNSNFILDEIARKTAETGREFDSL